MIVGRTKENRSTKCSNHRTIHLNTQFSLHLEDGLGRIYKPLGLLLVQVHIGDTQYPSSTKLCWQTQEHFPIDPIKPLSKNRHRVDLSLVPQNGAGQVSHWVPNCPGCVPFQPDHFIRTLYHWLVYILQCLFLISNLLVLQKTQDWNTPNANARPQCHRTISMLPYYIRLQSQLSFSFPTLFIIS